MVLMPPTELFRVTVVSELSEAFVALVVNDEFVAVSVVTPVPTKVISTHCSVPSEELNWLITGLKYSSLLKLSEALANVEVNVSVVSANATGVATRSAKVTTARVMSDELRRVFIFLSSSGPDSLSLYGSILF